MRLVAVLAAAVVLVQDGARAFASTGYDLSNASPLLGSSAGLGTVSAVAGSTEPQAGSDPCVTDASAQGEPEAAVYRVSPPTRALLDLRVRDDIDGSPSLCRVALYNGSTTFDPFDAAERSEHLNVESDGCLSGSSCGLERWLDGGRTYYVVLWASAQTNDTTGSTETSAADGDASDDSEARRTPALFTYSASVRRPIRMNILVSGHRIRDRCAGYHEVIGGRRFAMTARTAPNAAGTVRFTWYRKTDAGTWSVLGRYDRALRDGNAALAFNAGSSGKRRVKAAFLGSATMLPQTFQYRYVRYVTPRWRRYSDGGVKLDVRYYRQRYRLSCEAATLRMAHNYFHSSRIDDDMEVYRITGIDKRRPAVNGGCNPDRAFCGAVNGYMMSTGYGVHYGPIARAATAYDPCRPGRRLSGDSYSRAAIARNLNNGYPVIVWGAHRGATGIYERRWTAWDGHRVRAWSVEHTWTVVGFRGKPSYPTHFIVHDPSGSGHRTVSRSAFYGFIKYFKTAVVVRG